MTFNLFGFQEEDVTKLKSKRARLIGNDPGTGKTYEAIALDLANRSGDGNSKIDVDEYPVKKTLIIAPKSVLDVWDQHCMELTTEDVYVYDYKTRHTFLKQAMDKRRSGYFIINWESIRIKDMVPLQKVVWFHIVADECHRAKNRKSQQTVALKKLKTVYKTAMSGTPADNKPYDLWSILHWLWPNYYTAYHRFVNTYCKWEMATNPGTGEALGYKKFAGLNEDLMPHLHAEMAPWFVRRRKEDVLPDLPDKYYTRIWVDLGPKQRKAYDEMRKTMVAWTESHKDGIESQDPIIANAVVAQLVRLQQFSAGYLTPLLDENGKQIIKIRKKRDKRTGEILDEIEVPQFQMIDPSAKLDVLMDLLEDRGDEPVIVWSRFKSVINLLEERLQRKDISYGLLTGDVSQEDRNQNVRAFQAGDLRVFAGTIQAGGVGITLTRSSTVIFVDRVWSPSINLQAEDRAHRIGQTEAVEIIDLMARNTVDIGQAQQLAMKWKWIQMLLGDQVDAEQVIKEIDMAVSLEEEDIGE